MTEPIPAPANETAPAVNGVLTPLLAKIGVAALWFTAGFVTAMYLNRRRKPAS